MFFYSNTYIFSLKSTASDYYVCSACDVRNLIGKFVTAIVILKYSLGVLFDKI